MTTEEIWKPVQDWEDSYEVSNRGNVRSTPRKVKTRDGRTLPIRGSSVSATTTPKGYRQVRLWRDNKPHSMYVHKVVLRAFIGDRPEGMECRHLNGDPADNRLENLEWNTGSVNTKDKVRHGTHNQSRKTHCPRGHLLKEPNLRPSQVKVGKRDCLSCHREAGVARYQGREFDKDLADERYQDVMKGGSGLWTDRN